MPEVQRPHSTQQEVPPIEQLADWYLSGQLFADPAELLRQLLGAHRGLEEQLEAAQQALKAYRAIFAAWEGRDGITLNEEALRQWKSIAEDALSYPAKRPA